MADTPTMPQTPLFLARVNPPVDVLTHYGDLAKACEAWPVSDLPSGKMPIMASVPTPALICDQITGRTTPIENAGDAGIVIGVIGTLAAVFAFVIVRNGYRGLKRTVAEWYNRRVPTVTP